MNRLVEVGTAMLAAGAIGAGSGASNYEFTKHVTIPRILSHLSDKHIKANDKDADRLNHDISGLAAAALGGVTYVFIQRHRRQNPESDDDENV